MPHYRLALIGFGNVGQAFAKLLLRKEPSLKEKRDLTIAVTGIYTRHHGTIADSQGIDLRSALALSKEGAPIGDAHFNDAIHFLETCEADVLVENSSVNVIDGQPALSYMLAALNKSMHVITANKGPIVHAYEQLVQTAQKKGRQIRFESTVMDGTPIFSLWRETLPASTLLGFRGILNSTTNLVLSLMEDGQSFDAAVKQAQAIGIAETDPSGDLEGWDAAIKTAVLIRVLMGIAYTPQQVQRTGITAIDSNDIREAKERGRRIKLICEMKIDDGRICASVRPERISSEDPLFQICGTSTAVAFKTDVLGPLTIGAENPSPDTTAYGLLADLLNLHAHDQVREAHKSV